MDVKPYTPTFKCLLLGDSKVGKTSYTRRHMTGEFTRNFTSTIGAEIHTIPFNSNRGTVIFNVWDTEDINSQRGIREGLYQNTQCAIIMFDVQSHVSYKNISKWYANILKFCGNIPVTLCGNKVDAKFRSVLPNDIIFHYDKHMNYHEISAKCNYNFEKPFLSLAIQLLNDRNLTFIVLPRLEPAKVKLDVPFQLEIEQQIREARQVYREQALKEPPPKPSVKETQNPPGPHPPSGQPSRLLNGKKRKASLITIIGARQSSARMDEHKPIPRSPSLRYSRETLQVWINTASMPAVNKKPSLATESLASIKQAPKLKKKALTDKRASTVCSTHSKRVAAQTSLRMQRIDSMSDMSNGAHSKA